jgi:hypothetical protein
MAGYMHFAYLLNILLFAFSFICQANDKRGETPAPALKFVKNLNQWDKEIKYRAEIPGGFLFIKQQSLQYVFYETQAMSRIHGHSREGANSKATLAVPREIMINAHGFEVNFEGSNPAAIIEASGESSEKKNFFLGNNPTQWASGVPSYAQLVYKNIYPGIDLKLYTQHASLKYEFILAPRTDPDQIKLRYVGAEQMYIQQGALQINTSVNTVTETKPYCYQSVAGKQQVVPAQFGLEDNVLRFKFPKGYNKNQTLIIDPYLVFSTYSGSFTDNWGFTATYDEEGHLYSGGIEFGSRFPATNGAFQVSFAGEIDVAVLKYTPDGRSLIYATYLGGAQAEVPHSMIVNADNELIIMGTTGSDNFPVSADGFDKDFNGGQQITPVGGVDYIFGCDLYIIKLNATGNGLIGSTYLGGADNDGINTTNDITRSYGDEFRGEVNLDAEGNIYVASTTFSPDFPVVNTSSVSLQGGQDAVVSRFNSTLSALTWSTYFGGSDTDAASGIRIGASGSVYICGGTASKDLQVQASSIKPSMEDAEDGYIAKFQNNTLVTATYIGTASRDIACLIDLDASENVYIMGLSFGNYPLAGDVYSNTNGKQFIHAMNNEFTQTLFSTVIGSGRDFLDLSPTAFLVSECGFIYLSGWGGANNGRNVSGLPVTSDALKELPQEMIFI